MNQMKQVAIATTWGLLDDAGGKYPLRKLPELVSRLKSLGYGGIEMPIAYAVQYGSTKFETLMKEKNMKLVAMVFSGGPAPIPASMGLTSEFSIHHPACDTEDFHNVQRHMEVWRGQVEEAARLKSVLLSVTSHTGRDYFTSSEADNLFEYCIKTESELHVTINHETHRARCLYSPWVMTRFLETHPGLHLCADYSHFSAVAEMGAGNGPNGHFTKPLQDVIRACNKRVRHLHGRVGFEQGPQVPDPRTATWRPYFDAYMLWWAGIMAEASARGQEVFTTTPEFGPPAYAWTDPYNGDASLANVWEVNHWVGQQVSAMMAGAGHKAVTLLDDELKGKWDL